MTILSTFRTLFLILLVLQSASMAFDWISISAAKHYYNINLSTDGGEFDGEFDTKPLDATRFEVDLGFIKPLRYSFKYENSDFLSMQKDHKDTSDLRSVYKSIINELGLAEEGFYLIWDYDKFYGTYRNADSLIKDFSLVKNRVGLVFRASKEDQGTILQSILETKADDNPALLLIKIAILPTWVFSQILPENDKSYLMLAFEYAKSPQPFSYDVWGTLSLPRYDEWGNLYWESTEYSASDSELDDQFVSKRLFLRSGQEFGIFGTKWDALLGFDFGGGLSLFELSDDVVKRIEAQYPDIISPSGWISLNYSLGLQIGFKYGSWFKAGYKYDLFYEGNSMSSSGYVLGDYYFEKVNYSRFEGMHKFFANVNWAY